MSDFEYRRLDGMELEFVSGQLDAKPQAGELRFSFTFRLDLDFTHFVHVANQYIPGYLLGEQNAIHPELENLAYHGTYNKFAGAAGKIRSSIDLFRVFTDADNYVDDWTSGGLERMLHKPQFSVEGSQILMTGRQDFRWEGRAKPVEIAHLPLLSFGWQLELFRAEGSHVDPVVWLGYHEADFVFVEGVQVYIGQHYVDGKKLELGEIRKEQILTA